MGILDDEDLDICTTMVNNIPDTESLAKATNQIFKVNHVYKNHLQFKKHINHFCDSWGFTVVRSGHFYHKCSKGGSTELKKSRPNNGLRKTTPNKLGCKWHIHLKLLSATAINPFVTIS